MCCVSRVVLCCIMLGCAVLCSVALWGGMYTCVEQPWCDVMRCVVLCCVVLYCCAVRCPGVVLRRVVFRCVKLCCVAL